MLPNTIRERTEKSEFSTPDPKEGSLFLYKLVYNILYKYKGVIMYSLSQLEKKQIGLRIPQYLIEEIDEFTKEYNVNRTDIVIEALRSYLSEQKSRIFYEKFDNSVKEAKKMIAGELEETTLGDLINELNYSSDS